MSEKDGGPAQSQMLEAAVMSDDTKFLIGVGAVMLSFAAALVTIVTVRDKQRMECIELLKDKSGAEITLICK